VVVRQAWRVATVSQYNLLVGHMHVA